MCNEIEKEMKWNDTKRHKDYRSETKKKPMKKKDRNEADVTPRTSK